MIETTLPKAWKDLISKGTFLPVIVKTVERIHDPTWSMEVNYHDHFEMVYIKRGTAIFNISNNDVTLGPNNIVIIKPNQPHKFSIKSQKACEFVVLSFKFRNQYNKEYSHVSLDDFIEFVQDKKTGSFITLKVSKRNDIVYTMNRILREKESKDLWGDFLSYLLIMELFVLTSRAIKMEWEENIKTQYLKVTGLMYSAKQYIDKNYEKDVTVTDMAKHVFLSQSYFAHAFKSEFKISPKSYLLKVRIGHSKELLAKTDMKVKDIALAVGFSSQQRHNDIFKKYTNTTPLKYRQKIKNEKLNK